MQKRGLNNKAQAATEFLTTYGWAVLILILVTVGLVNLGVFNPPKTLNTCSVSAPLGCIDIFIYSQASNSTSFISNLTIKANSVSSLSITGYRNTGGSCNNASLIGILNGNGYNYVGLTCPQGNKGDKEQGEIDLAYTLIGVGIKHTITLRYSATRELLGVGNTTSPSPPGDTTSPTVTIIHSPLLVNDTNLVNYSVIASDLSGVRNISIFVDSINVRTCNNVISCSYIGGTYTSNSTHNYYATATDIFNNIGRDPLIGFKNFNVTSSNDSVVPMVTILSPTNGQVFNNGTQVILIASVTSGSTFAGWSGEGCSGTGNCVVTMNSVRSVTAIFDAVNITTNTTGPIYYVSTTGNDANNGFSLTTPFKTLQRASTIARAGNTIYIRGGVYWNYTRFDPPTTGRTVAQPIVISAYLNETVILDGSLLPWNASNPWYPGCNGVVSIYTDYLIFKNLEIRNGCVLGVVLYGNNNKFQNLKIYNNSYSGLGGQGSYNLFENSLFYDNGAGDPPNSDGIAFSSGTNNTIRYCKSWNNGDDGFDMWASTNNILEYNNAHDNVGGPTGTGDSNGFKLGIGGGNIVRFNIAWNNGRGTNAGSGFDTNGGLNNLISQNTAFNNKGFGNYRSAVSNTFYNDISANGSMAELVLPYTSKNNTWDLTITCAFESINPTSPNFLHLKADSLCIDKGMNLGFPYSGRAPDLGAFEYNGSFGQNYPLIVNKIGTGSGTVTSNPGGINCGSTCSASYSIGNQSTLTVSGTASDNVALYVVKVRLNNGLWINATGTTSWNYGLALILGNNIIDAQSFDTSNNPSIIKQVNVTYN